jgi:mannose-6-phosphate isomerase-like protein (cupin superfamily)
MVYVLKGWVRFEYEDIGEVELRAGTCVYQPPRIRHREIAHSDDLELVEITSPAEFVTREVPAPDAAAPVRQSGSRSDGLI